MMKQVIVWVLGLACCVSGSAVAQNLCDSFPTIFDQYDAVLFEFLEDIEDLDEDGFRDTLSLSLIEAVACVGPDDDLKLATESAFAANLAAFDGELSADLLSEFRLVLAAMMMIGVDIQADLNATFGDVFRGDYVAVQCSGLECTPDPLDSFASVAIVTRAANEPYTGAGDLDLDGTTNLTEAENVAVQNGARSDFVIAATSDNLDGTEEIRNPDANDGGGGGSCFIATAVYGTPLAGEVDVLRDYRDEVLLVNPFGAAFVDSYYRLSPGIADAVASWPVLRSMVRSMLVPVLLFARVPGWGLMALVLGIALVGRRRMLRRRG